MFLLVYGIRLRLNGLHGSGVRHQFLLLLGRLLPELGRVRVSQAGGRSRRGLATALGRAAPRILLEEKRGKMIH